MMTIAEIRGPGGWKTFQGYIRALLANPSLKLTAAERYICQEIADADSQCDIELAFIEGEVQRGQEILQQHVFDLVDRKAVAA